MTDPEGPPQDEPLLPAVNDPGQLSGSRRGRPTKLTPELQAKFVEALKVGNYRKDACAAVGISKRTFVTWARLGREDNSSVHGQFLRAVLEAEQWAKKLMLKSILRAAQGMPAQLSEDGHVVRGELKPDWKAAGWWLSRKFPEQFARTTGDPGVARRDYQIDPDEERDGDEAVLEEWRARNVDVQNVFVPHEIQRAAINCFSRFMAIVAGVGGGKSRSGAINFWQRVLRDDAPGVWYFLVAPDTINGQVMREWFVKAAPPGWILNPAGTGPDYAKTWTLKNGANVQFRSLDKPGKFVASRARGIWADEFTLMQAAAWRVSMRGRLSAAGAGVKSWVIFTGTPRGKNWAHQDIWRKTDEHDDEFHEDYEGFTWPSRMNPAVDPDDVAEAKRNLPRAYYEREWEASWEAFHGQIYEEFNASMVVDLSGSLTTHPEGSIVEAGIDWGFAKPGAMEVGRLNPDGSWDILLEVQVAKKDADWWEAEAIQAVEVYGVTTFWCDPEEPERISRLRKALNRWAAEEEDRVAPRVRAAYNAVKPGLRYVASLFKQDLIRIHKTCTMLAAQLSSYRWKQDKSGEDTEEVLKENDHGPDALRYLTFSRHKAKGDGVVAMSGAGSSSTTPAKPKKRARRRGEKRMVVRRVRRKRR